MTETTDSTGARPIGRAIARDALRVHGPDAYTFLQGQLSQDIDALAIGTSTWTFVLQPQGKVDVWARITKTGADAFVLDVDGGHGAHLEERLTRFKIRTKAEIETLDWHAVGVRGAGSPHDDVPVDVLRLPVVGPALEGYDLLGPVVELPDGVDHVDANAWTAHRIEQGVPAMGHELGEDTIPAEIGQWIVDTSVAFDKGCFVGQELVARIDSRGGNVPRRLRALLLDEAVAEGTEVQADGPTSAVTSAAVSERFGPVALAFCGRKVEPGATVDVGGVDAVVHELPLGPADQR